MCNEQCCDVARSSGWHRWGFGYRCNSYCLDLEEFPVTQNTKRKDLVPLIGTCLVFAALFCIAAAWTSHFMSVAEKCGATAAVFAGAALISWIADSEFPR